MNTTTALMCPKGCGPLAKERNLADVDYYCRMCGWRYVDAQRVPATPSAISVNNVLRRNGFKVPAVSKNGARLHPKECANCGVAFMGVWCQKYCSAECRSLVRRTLTIRYCQTCGKQLPGDKMGPRLYCDPDCKRGTPGGYVGDCLNCGKAMYYRHKNARYCNTRCYTQHKNREKAA